MLRTFTGVAAGAIIVAFALVLLWPLHVRAAECAGQSGLASWYGGKHHGRLTASGQRFDQNAMTAAHKSMAFGSRVRVTYGKRSVVVTISDRGPFVRGRIIDLSRGAATKLGLIPAGVGKVCIERVG